LIEHYAGAFPLWLSPEQARILTITERADETAKALHKRFNALGIRAEIDLRNEKIGFKIREAQVQKVPYMLVLGDKEVEAGVAAVRSRKEGDLGQMAPDALAERLLKEIQAKAN
ncbi:MAG: threonine--tRNA ligase, partial [Clostridiales bacterium]|nr:threonine--tRNA ligase [Clostridiales bacterium]